MARGSKIEGKDSLFRKLKEHQRKMKGIMKGNVVVGFQTSYALVVHERLDTYHPVGQAKFLEEPARRMKSNFRTMVVRLMGQGKSLLEALLIVGLALQREAQLLCPVDTGLLKNSAFTEVER